MTRIYLTLKNHIVAAFALMLTLGLSATAVAGPATDFVRAQAGDIIGIVNDAPDVASRTDALKIKVGGLIDFDLLAERTLGRHWDARTAAEKVEFTGLLRELIETSYATQLGNERIDNDAYTVEFLEERERRGRYTVDAAVRLSGKVHIIAVRMLQTDDGQWRIYDIVTDDISLQESYAESFDQIISTHGWAELTSRIRSRITQMNAE